MIVTCERCSARYKLDDNKIKGRGARITCPKCKHVFVVLNKGQEPELDDPEEPSEEPEEPEEPRSTNPLAQDPDSASGLVGTGRRADQLDFRKVGISTWKVKVKIGLVYDFSDIGTLRKYIQDRRVTDDDVISHDGSEWVRIGDIPDLDAYFLQVYEELEEQHSGRDDDEADTGEDYEDDGPTMVVGMGSLRSNISTGVFERPGHKAENAPPNTRPLPGKGAAGGAKPPASDNNRFVDPFESLKERQRDRMRAKRGGVATGTHRKGQGKGQGKGDTGKKSVNYFLVAAGVMAVLAVVWFFLLRPRPPAPTPEPQVGPTVDDVAVKRSAEQERARLLAQLEASTNPVAGEQDDPPQEEPDGGQWVAVNPEIKRQKCASGEWSGDACRGLSATRPVGPTPGPGTGPSDAGTHTTTAADHAAAGRTAAQRGDWSTAATAYGMAASMEPNNASYRMDLATVLYKGGTLERAQSEFQNALGRGDKRAHKFLGLIADQFGDAAGAVDHLRQFDAAFPGDPEVQRKLQELTGG
jgi:predicted Zn finger-like uncharacterized protein